MAQRKHENETTLEQDLRLVQQLSAEDQEQVLEELKLQWLRREMKMAEDELDRGEGIPAEQVFSELEERYKRMKTER
jgi:hypothetical protein